MSKKLLILIFVYLLPLCLLTYLLANVFTSKKPNTYAKIAQGQPISILVTGDSIGAGSGAGSPKHNFANRLKVILKEKYGVTASIENPSLGGNTSYAEYVRVHQLPKDQSFDLVIICCGQNDLDRNLAKNYEALIRLIKTKYPKASVISVLQSSQKKFTQKIKTIQSLAQHYGILTADTITPFTNGENGEYSTLSRDGIHPNAKGYAIYANVLASIIDHEVQNLKTAKSKTKPLPPPLFPGCLEYLNFQEYPTNLITRTGNDFTLKLSAPAHSHVGIDINHLRGSNYFELIINGNQAALFDKYRPYKLQTNISEQVQFPTGGVYNLQLKFKRQEQADTFRGFFVSYPKYKQNIFFSFPSLLNNKFVIYIFKIIVWQNIVIGLIVGIIASYLVSKYRESKKRAQELKRKQELLNPLVETAINLSDKLYYCICENEKNYEKNLKIIDIIEKFRFPSSYVPDCTTCERVLIQMNFLYDEAKNIRNLERGLICNKDLNQVIKIIEIYEEHLQNSFDLLKQFKNTKEKYKCDIYYDEMKKEISRNPYMRLNSAMNSFISSIAYLFKPDGIFNKIASRTVTFNDEYYEDKKIRCKSCNLYCKPLNFQ